MKTTVWIFTLKIFSVLMIWNFKRLMTSERNVRDLECEAAAFVSSDSVMIFNPFNRFFLNTLKADQ